MQAQAKVLLLIPRVRSRSVSRAQEVMYRDYFLIKLATVNATENKLTLPL